MNDPMLDPRKSDWNLEVVRGAVAGRAYPLINGEVVLGNRDEGTETRSFLNLADQEGASPRRMAAHHVALSRSAERTWTIRDLDTPGGTFVNNRRVMAGVAQPLAEGDVIQLGSVQLRLARIEVSATPTVTSFTYRSSISGTTCRTWDDFLAFSAQRWDELRDDLVSGRLADSFASAGHPDLIPSPSKKPLTTELADERLDAWLARLPTRSPSKPELDVHPLRMVIAVASGGVTIRRKVRVSNVGHRLLRAKIGVAPGGANLTLDPTFEGREVVIRDFVDVPFEVNVPDPFPGGLQATLVISGGGVEKQVLIQVDRKVNATQDGSTVGDPDPSPVAGPFAAFGAMPVGKRVVIGGLVAPATRLVVGVVGGAIGEDAMAASGPDVPHLGGVVVALGLLGAVGVGWWMGVSRKGGRGDALWGAIAGAGLGALGASVVVAACQAIEPTLGPLAGSPIAVCGLWGLLGAASAGVIASSRRGEASKESTR